MTQETLPPEMIHSALTDGATVTYEIPQGALRTMAAQPDLLRGARFQICMGGDPIPSPRTPVCVVYQLEAMQTLEGMGIEPPSLYVFQSPLWQLHENGSDARGGRLVEEEIFAGSAVAGELVFRFVERFYPDLLSKVKFAWLPYNNGALRLIRQWSGEVSAKMPREIAQLARKSGGSFVYALRHGLSYGALAQGEGLVIGTGGSTEVPFQKVAEIISEQCAKISSPLALLSYRHFGASYYSRLGEPTLVQVGESQRYEIRMPLRREEILNEGEPRITCTYSQMGSAVRDEMGILQEKTDRRYLPFLTEFARGLVEDPQLQFTKSIAALMKASAQQYEETVNEWMDYSFEFCQKFLGWPRDMEDV
ncbi:hypothetical protein HY086_01440 [Candidatus Gottesmanbacteria bacterium]|nr:hypothetical protein [Candidatus Gottesmanbacteria bacterium]